MLQTLWYNHIQYYTAYYMYKGKGQYYNRYMYVRIMYTITCIIMHLYMLIAYYITQRKYIVCVIAYVRTSDVNTYA